MNLAIGCDEAGIRFNRPRFDEHSGAGLRELGVAACLGARISVRLTPVRRTAPLPTLGNCAVRISVSVIEETASCGVNNGKTGSIRRVPTKDERRTRRRQQTEGELPPPPRDHSVECGGSGVWSRSRIPELLPREEAHELPEGSGRDRPRRVAQARTTI